MLRSDSKVLKFGEVYFSTIYENKIKGWHLHKESVLNYTCVTGEVKLVLLTIGLIVLPKINTKKLFCLKNYALVTIPPNIWNGFKGLNFKSQ